MFRISTPVIAFGDHTTVLKYIDFDFVLGADGVKILKPNSDLRSDLLFYIAKQIDIPESYDRHFNQLKEAEVILPTDKSEQARIADILTDIDDDITTHEKLISKKRQVKTGVMQQLLTGKTRLLEAT